jgi:hypothetical protein
MINIAEFRINAGLLIKDFRLKYSIINENVYLGFIDINDVNILKEFSHVNNFLVTNNELGIRNEMFRFIFSEENLLENSRLFNTTRSLYKSTLVDILCDETISFDEFISINIMDLL